jgi:hypothetical protein
MFHSITLGFGWSILSIDKSDLPKIGDVMSTITVLGDRYEKGI